MCLRPISDHCVELCAVWRASHENKIIYHPLDPDKDHLTPLTLDMLGEDLPTLLQTLLVGIEHQICRVSLNDVASFNQEKVCVNGNNKEDDATNNHKTSPKSCGLKRRELITKNKVINSKYSLKRMNSALKNASDDSGSHKNESGDGVDSPLDPTSMPLFCLGGSFPHIDSDEDSCEDSTIRKFDEGRSTFKSVTNF